MKKDADGVYLLHEEEYGEVLDQLKMHSGASGAAALRHGRAGAAQSSSATSGRPVSPPVAASLSMLLPGAGQAYNGQVKQGAALFLSLMLVVVGHWSVLTLWPSMRETFALLGIQRSQLLFTAFAIDFLAGFAVLWGIHQAYRRAEEESGAFEGVNVPILPALASLVLPGWGQIANGQIGKALVFIVGLWPGLAGAAVLFTRVIASPASVRLHAGLGLSLQDAAVGAIGLSTLMWILSIYDAALVSRFRQAGR